jgi:hypothetical protein
MVLSSGAVVRRGKSSFLLRRTFGAPSEKKCDEVWTTTVVR